MAGSKVMLKPTMLQPHLSPLHVLRVNIAIDNGTKRGGGGSVPKRSNGELQQTVYP
jgi:hypothetical protein